jgi:hypothetical protein
VKHGGGIRLERVCDSATTACVKIFITYITVIVPVSNILVADVFGTGMIRCNLVL